MKNKRFICLISIILLIIDTFWGYRFFNDNFRIYWTISGNIHWHPEWGIEPYLTIAISNIVITMTILVYYITGKQPD